MRFLLLWIQAGVCRPSPCLMFACLLACLLVCLPACQPAAELTWRGLAPRIWCAWVGQFLQPPEGHPRPPVPPCRVRVFAHACSPCQIGNSQMDGSMGTSVSLHCATRIPARLALRPAGCLLRGELSCFLVAWRFPALCVQRLLAFNVQRPPFCVLYSAFCMLHTEYCIARGCVRVGCLLTGIHAAGRRLLGKYLFPMVRGVRGRPNDEWVEGW